MSAIELQQAIKLMRKLEMSDEEILAELKKTGYEGDSLPSLENIVPSANAEGTKPAITLEEMTFEQRAAEKGITTEAQKTLEPVVKLREIELGLNKK